MFSIEDVTGGVLKYMFRVQEVHLGVDACLYCDKLKWNEAITILLQREWGYYWLLISYVSRVLDKIITESLYYFWNATETQQAGVYDGLPEILGGLLFTNLYPLCMKSVGSPASYDESDGLTHCEWDS